MCPKNINLSKVHSIKLLKYVYCKYVLAKTFLMWSIRGPKNGPFLARLCMLHAGLICMTFCLLSVVWTRSKREKIIHISGSIGDMNTKPYRNRF